MWRKFSCKICCGRWGILLRRLEAFQLKNSVRHMLWSTWCERATGREHRISTYHHSATGEVSCHFICSPPPERRVWTIISSQCGIFVHCITVFKKSNVGDFPISKQIFLIIFSRIAIIVYKYAISASSLDFPFVAVLISLYYMSEVVSFLLFHWTSVFL